MLLCLLAVLLSACAAPAAPVMPTAAVQTVEVTQVVTQEVTVEMEQVVEVQVTNTPTLTPDWTATPSLSPTVTLKPTATTPWEPPRVEVTGAPGTTRTVCWYGPGEQYLYKTGENNGIWMRALGRNEDGTWIIIDAGKNITNLACWILTSNAKFLSGSVADLPVTWLGLPGSVLYPSPSVYTATREGNEVTIVWQPIWMTEDDYRGYLIETWVCQGGKLVFKPLGYVSTYTDNQLVIAQKGALSVKVTDEPGCNVPSRARLYAVEKHGYTNYVMIPWPKAP